MPTIGFLGGTGIEARGLALRFARAGAAVILGSRSRERAAQAADECNSILAAPLIRGTTNESMLGDSEFVMLTVPYSQALDAVETCARSLRPGQVLVDVTVPMTFRDGRPEYVDQAGESNSEILARRLPSSVPLVAAFKTIPATILADLQVPLNCDDFVCGDDPEAKKKLISAAALIPSFRPLDAGSLQTARALERMTVLLAGLNRTYKKRGARFRIEGL
jgi:NADPH-dependent F420 reductase